MNQKIRLDHKPLKNWLFWLQENQHVAWYIWPILQAQQQAKYQGVFYIQVFLVFDSDLLRCFENNWPFFPTFQIHSSVLHHVTYAADSLTRATHLDKVKATAVQEAYVVINKVTMLYGFLQLYSSSALVRWNHTMLTTRFFFFGRISNKFLFWNLQESVAYILAGRNKSNGTQNRVNSKKGPKYHYVNSRANNNPIVVNNANGAYWICVISLIFFFIFFIFRK